MQKVARNPCNKQLLVTHRKKVTPNTVKQVATRNPLDFII